MKIYIGPYKYWWGPYQIAEKLPIGEQYQERLGKWINDNTFCTRILDWINGLRDYENQRTFIRIDDYDVWGADVTLAMIIHPVLIKLRDKKVGSPWVDLEDVPERLRPADGKVVIDNLGGTDELYHKRWEYVLDQMIYAFSKIEKDIAYDKKVQEGLRLFAKYYGALWD